MWRYPFCGISGIRGAGGCSIFFAVALLPPTQEIQAQPSSIFSSGTWYKLSVRGQNVYKIEARLLREMNIHLGTLDPDHIRLYGSGTEGPLPQANSVPRYQDPQEIPLYVVGGGDGQWHEEDYALFFAPNVDQYAYDEPNRHITYKRNPYHRQRYYFLTRSTEEGLRLPDRPSIADAPTQVLSDYDFVYVHEEDEKNLLRSGREWYSHYFYAGGSNRQSFSIGVPNLKLDSGLSISSFVFGACYQAACGFSVAIDGYGLPEGHLIEPIVRVRYGKKGRLSHAIIPVPAGRFGNPFVLQYTFTGGDDRSFGGLNRFLVEGTAALRYTGGTPLFFHSKKSTTNTPTQYVVATPPSDALLWHVTRPLSPQRQLFSAGGNQLSFVMQSAQLERYVVFSPTSSELPAPRYVGIVPRQNLKDQRTTQLLIITHPEFLAEATRLARFRRTHDRLSVKVATTEQIYHEFSSGAEDPTALRDYVRYLYNLDKGHSLRYLLLLGDCSYDFLNIRKNDPPNYVPVYQSREHMDATRSYSSDDYYGFLDLEEGTWPEDETSTNPPHDLDIGIGRIPAKSAEEAAQVVDKIIRYATPPPATEGATWQQTLYFVADDGEGNYIHRESERIANSVSENHPHVRVEKFFLDNYPQPFSGGRQLAPQASNRLKEIINQGALIVNFIGHGSTSGWTDENVLVIEDIDNLSNSHHLPLFFTGTCDFGKYDGDFLSGGEKMLLHPLGGGIALLTTTRAITGASNARINEAFYEAAFQRDSEGYYARLGDIVRQTKNKGAHGVSNRNFALLGDPSMRLSYPEHTVCITHLNGVAVADLEKPLTALSEVQVRGEIREQKGKKLLSDYAGVLDVTVYDKPLRYLTLGDENVPYSYSKDNPIFRGKTSIAGGFFSFSFLLPKDISYQRGLGKIITLATGAQQKDAAGGYNGFHISGSHSGGAKDNRPPQIRLYLNNPEFKDGDRVAPKPTLLGELNDESGIKISRKGLDDPMPLSLNGAQVESIEDFYTADLDTYQAGRLVYPLGHLEEGRYTLTLRAQDNHNNTRTERIRFVVSKKEPLRIRSLKVYPNPAHKSLTFSFEHDKKNDVLRVDFSLHDMLGRELFVYFWKTPGNNGKVDSLYWEREQNAVYVPAGVYLYTIGVFDEEDGTSNKVHGRIVFSAP